jgi:hypothetical protein
MPRNQKPTKVIAGRTLKAATVEPDGVLIVFDDQSNMKVKTVGPATIPPGGKVKSVQETKAEFKVDFEDGSSATLYLADLSSSVAVRDKNNVVEYLGQILVAQFPVRSPYSAPVTAEWHLRDESYQAAL